MQIDAMLKKDIVIMIGSIPVVAHSGDVVKVDPLYSYATIEGYCIEVYPDEYSLFN